jgi:hyperosmotically inducible periplasmic protein
MTNSNIRFLVLAILLLVASACGASADKEVNSEATPAADADNTARNDRDESATATTPFDQGENAQDLEISANIRKAIVADDSLSLNAHNVKIVTNGGTVTLSGPVKSAQEKGAIEAKAKQIAGEGRVESFLEVEANQ